MVTSLKATDEDSGYNGEVYYSLVDGDYLGDFVLAEENSTGELKLYKHLILIDNYNSVSCPIYIRSNWNSI